MTLTDAGALVLETLQDPSGVLYSDIGEVYFWANEACRDFSEQTRCLDATYDLQVTPNENRYCAGDDTVIAGVFTVRLSTAPYTYSEPLTRIETYATGAAAFVQDRPTRWSADRISGILRVMYVGWPSETWDSRWIGWRIPVPVTDPALPLDFPDNFFEGARYFACIRLAASRERFTEARMWRGLYNQWIVRTRGMIRSARLQASTRGLV